MKTPDINLIRKYRENIYKEIRAYLRSAKREEIVIFPGSTILLSFLNTSVIIDPACFDSNLISVFIETIKSVSIDYILITHLHADHYDPDILSLLCRRGTKIIAPLEIIKDIKKDVKCPQEMCLFL